MASGELQYDKENGSLTNFEEVVSQIFYMDLIFKIPYEYDSFYIIPLKNNSQGFPSSVKLNLDLKDGRTMVKRVNITYDRNPNIYKSYLRAGGIIEAAENNVSNEGRGQLFEGKFIPPNNPSSITFMDEDNLLEHMYFAEYQYDEKQRVISGSVTYFDNLKSGSPVISSIICSYVDSAIK